MFFNMKICIIALSLCSVVLCNVDEENIKVRSTKRSPIPFELGEEPYKPYTKFQAALEENAPKGRSDHERKITARKGVPNEVPDLNDTTPEPLPLDLISDKGKLENELHITTFVPLAASDKENVAKHRPRERIDENSPEIKNSTVSIDSNETKNQAKPVNESTKNGINSTKTDTSIKTPVENATQSLNKTNVEQSSKNTSTNNSATSNFNSSASTTPTTTVATTTNTTESPAPTTISANGKNKKPTTTYVGDQVELEHKSTTKTSGKLSVDEPFAQLSKESKAEPAKGHRDYIIPVVALIFIIPIILGALLISYRRLKDYWSTRHYRRMDFLVDGMYND